eukprot:Hpha_TRINITY_DN11725_c0_g1::TRINITY_DN11725_c0_g1_i1::g.31937::m.31937/K03681/RRP40, EXOSC3; exosome complex component RRP40
MPPKKRVVTRKVTAKAAAPVAAPAPVAAAPPPAFVPERQRVALEQYSWVMPGDEVVSVEPEERITIGRGLRQDRGVIVATVAGQYVKWGGKHMVLADERAYMPRKEDVVVGIVLRNAGFAGGYLVDIGAGTPARLDSLAFDGASKRNRPDINPGGVVYCRVERAERDIDVQLSCCSLLPNKKDWMTGEALFGEQHGGTLLRLRPSFCRRLLTPADTILSAIGERVAFECTRGVNGMVWIKSEDAPLTLRVASVLQHLEALIYGGDEEDNDTPEEAIAQMLPVSVTATKRKAEDEAPDPAPGDGQQQEDGEEEDDYGGAEDL